MKLLSGVFTVFMCVFAANVSIFAGSAGAWPPSMPTLAEDLSDDDVIHAGSSVLTVTRAFICNSGESDDPCGVGPDIGGVSLFKAFHGEHGNIYVTIRNPRTGAKLGRSILRGPSLSPDNKLEWLDNQGMTFERYGIFDWHFAPPGVDVVQLDFWERDGDRPYHANDDLISVLVSKEASVTEEVCASTDSRGMRCCDMRTTICLRTVDLGIPAPEPRVVPQRRGHVRR